MVLSHQEVEHFIDITGIGPDKTSETKIIFLDKYSNVAPWHLANLSAACSQAMGNDAYFGGIPIILCGDLRQKAPVRAGYSLSQMALIQHLHFYRSQIHEYNVASKFKQRWTRSAHSQCIHIPKIIDPIFEPNHPCKIGADIFCNARWIEFDEQQRSKDPEQTEIVEKMGRYESLTNADLETYKEISAQDFLDDSWIEAPLICSTNMERLILTPWRCTIFAKRHKQKIYRWLSKVKESHNLLRLKMSKTKLLILNTLWLAHLPTSQQRLTISLGL